MANIHFGFSHIASATPALIMRVRLAFNFLVGATVTFLPGIAAQAHTTTDNLSFWIGLATVGINTVSVLFGVPITTATIPAQDAAAVETH